MEAPAAAAALVWCGDLLPEVRGMLVASGITGIDHRPIKHTVHNSYHGWGPEVDVVGSGANRARAAVVAAGALTDHDAAWVLRMPDPWPGDDILCGSLETLLTEHLLQVTKTPSWPRSWANFSLSQLCSHRTARASLHKSSRPNTSLAPGAPAPQPAGAIGRGHRRRRAGRGRGGRRQGDAAIADPAARHVADVRAGAHEAGGAQWVCSSPLRLSNPF